MIACVFRPKDDKVSTAFEAMRGYSRVTAIDEAEVEASTPRQEPSALGEESQQ